MPAPRWPAWARSSWWCPRPAASATRWCWPPPHVAGVHRVFTIGGAQAVAALAYGTATVPRVDKITGPGNAYVASAKRRVFGQVGIDMIAGPSEILVLADGSTPRRLGGDGPVQPGRARRAGAEHPAAPTRPTSTPCGSHRPPAARHAARDVIRASLEGRGALIHTRSMEEACAISNRIAPEHLESAAPTRTAGSRCCATPAPSSWAPSPAKAWATTAPGPTTCCRPRARRAFQLAAGRVRLRQAQQPDRGQRSRRAGAGPDRRRAGGATAKGCRRMSLPAGRWPCMREPSRWASMLLYDRRWTRPRKPPQLHPPGRAVHARLRHPAQRRLIKLDAMENPPSGLPPVSAAARTGRAPGRVAINRYPVQSIGRRGGRAVATSACPRAAS
jgi:hypothetical protein